MSADATRQSGERFEFLAGSIAGRRVAVQVAADGELSYSDGRCIYVPARRLLEEPEVWRDVVAQALLLGIGSLRPGILRRLVGRPQVARRYAYLEVRRGLSIYGERLPLAFAAHPSLLVMAGWPLTASAEESLRLAAGPCDPEGGIPAFVGTLRPILVLRHTWDDGEAQALTAGEQAGEFKLADETVAFSDEEETESSGLLDRLKSRFSNGNPMSQALAQLFGQGRSRGQAAGEEAAGGGGQMPLGRVERVWRRGVRALRAHLPATLAGLTKAVDNNPFGNRYPEWDCILGRYRQNWVRVDEVEPWNEEGAQDLQQVLLAPSRELRRGLSRLGREYQMQRRQSEGAEFDIGALIEHAIDLHCGQTPHDLDIYRASRRTRRDLGVVVAVDISGSSGERAGGGETVFRQQLRAAWQLAAALDGLGDRVALYGFHSWGRELACMVRLKGHEESWSARICERCTLLQPAGFSRLGAAVRYGEQLLSETMRLPNRLLILISDGFSYDQDYEQLYAREDTRMALREAQAAGTACVCLSIGGATSAQQLEAVFGAINLLMVDEGEQWQARIGAVCQRALQAVRMAKGRRGRQGMTMAARARRGTEDAGV